MSPIGCISCGGRFPIARPAPSVVCPFCAQRQALPEALLRELGEFRRDFEVERAPADSAAEHADAWRRFSRENHPIGMRSVVLLQVLLLVPIGLAILAGKLAPEGSAAPGVVAIAGYAVVIGALLWVRRLPGAAGADVSAGAQAGTRSRASLGIHEISCPSCGAPNPYNPRHESHPCAHCRSALFPSSTVIGRSLEAARSGKREALLAKYRAERAGTAQLALGMRAHRAGTFARYKSALLISLAAAVLLGATTEEAEGRVSTLLLPLWLLVPLPMVIAARRVRQENELQAQLSAALALVARQGHGAADGDVSQYLAWLDQHWAGPYDVPYADLGAWFHSVRLTVASYPALLELNMDPKDDGCVKALLAAWIPGASDTGAPLRYDALPKEATAFGDRLLQLGWSVQVTSAGLVARMDLAGTGTRELQRRPESATLLTEVLAHMAGLARSLGSI